MCKHNRLIDVQYYDINMQHINVTGSMKLCNTKLLVVGIMSAAYQRWSTVGGQNKWNALHLSSI